MLLFVASLEGEDVGEQLFANNFNTVLLPPEVLLLLLFFFF